MKIKQTCKIITNSLLKDSITFLKVIRSFLSGCLIVVYGMSTISFGLIWWSVESSDTWLTIWKPWAIYLAPYWTIINLILAFVSWISYRIYQAIKTA